jgi:hypothetical protein
LALEDELHQLARARLRRALSEVGLPRHAIAVALLFFNLGVEICQLLFVAVVLAPFTILQRISMAFVGGHGEPAASMAAACGAYGIGRIASFWLIDRVLERRGAFIGSTESED